MTFYDTILTNQDKQLLEANNVKMDEKIYELLRHHPNKGFTAHEVNDRLTGILTSVRRSLYNLEQRHPEINVIEKKRERGGVENFVYAYTPGKSDTVRTKEIFEVKTINQLNIIKERLGNHDPSRVKIIVKRIFNRITGKEKKIIEIESWYNPERAL